MTELAKYEAAQRALDEAVAVDEVLEIRSQAEAWRIYARQAKNVDLEIKAARIRFRAERRLGEMLLASDLAKGGRPSEKTCSDSEQVPEAPPTLAEAGIDRKLSSRAQKMALLPAEKFTALTDQHAAEMRGGTGRVSMDLLKLNAEADGRIHRRDLAAALSSKSIELPTGRCYPAAYIDCPWERKGGIGNRAYENHYPTMTWPGILAFLRKARDTLLPDAWAFFWIPRAHLLTLVEVETEVTIAATGQIVIAKVMMPLAWACAQALGMDSYSTCFVWTKTNEDHPDVSGSGLIAWDQDELLLLFKRGRGLPKPSGAEKFGSNHRERATDHSRKPEFYRHMIATMVGCDLAGNPLPVLEMFARVDAEHPLPPNWKACGNQAAPTQCDCQHPETTAEGFAAVSVDCPVHSGDERTITSATPFFSFAEVPSAGETVTAAAEATSAGASAAAAVTDIPAFLRAAPPAFPPTELADLAKFECRDDARIPAAQLEALAPEYVRRGLVHAWCGSWRLSPAGVIRLQVLERERAERAALFQKHLSEDDFAQWQAIAAIARGEPVEGEIVRHLIGGSYAECGADDLLALTKSGLLWLATVEVHVEKREGIQQASAPAPTPYQLDLVQMLEGAQ